MKAFSTKCPLQLLAIVNPAKFQNKRIISLAVICLDDFLFPSQIHLCFCWNDVWYIRCCAEKNEALKAMPTSPVKKNVESNMGLYIYIYHCGFLYCSESIGPKNNLLPCKTSVKD